jgi:hypothetical protein
MMSEAIPPVPTGPDSSNAPPAQPPVKPRWPASRVILLVLLVLCLGALAKEYLGGRLPWQHAHQLLDEKLLPSEGAPPENGKAAPPGQAFVDVTDEEVHKLLEREPDEPKITDPGRVGELISTSEDPAAKRTPSPIKMVEIYKFPGILRTYELRVAYIEGRVPGKSAYIFAGVYTATPYRWETQ